MEMEGPMVYINKIVRGKYWIDCWEESILLEDIMAIIYMQIL